MKCGNGMVTSKGENIIDRAVKSVKRTWQLYVMILLPLLFIIVFCYGPLYGAQIAFKHFSPVKGIWGSQWVGFENFNRFFSSPVFKTLIVNTLSLSFLNLIFSFPFPILLALGLNYLNNRTIKKIIQTTTYIPYFISTVVMVSLLKQILNTSYGAVNVFIKALGHEPVNFFEKPQYFRALYVISGIWQNAGWSSIIYLSALSSVDMQLHEAAMIDGANKFQRVWHVDIPSIAPTVIVLFILNFGSFMRTGFEKIYLMQTDLNLSVSEVIDTYVYKMGLGASGGNFAYSTAIGLFQSVIGFGLILLVNWLSKRVTESALW